MATVNTNLDLNSEDSNLLALGRCYVGSRVKGEFEVRWKFRLHCMLLFGRDGVGRQTIQRVRFAKRLIFENRISLRDGLNY